MLRQWDTHQLIQRGSIHVLSLSHQTIARDPVIENIIHHKTRAVALGDTCLLGWGVGEISDTDIYQRLAIFVR